MINERTLKVVSFYECTFIIIKNCENTFHNLLSLSALLWDHESYSTTLALASKPEYFKGDTHSLRNTSPWRERIMSDVWVHLGDENSMHFPTA